MAHMNNNDFKFRAAITVSGYDAAGNDKDYKILVYGVAPYGCAGIGFGYDDFMEAVQNSGYSEEEQEEIVDQLEDEQCWNDEWCNYWGIVDRCTGFSDKNGNLIYEGDIVQYKNDKGVVRFGGYSKDDIDGEDTILGFFIKWKPKVLWRQDFMVWANEGITVVGNVHKGVNK